MGNDMKITKLFCRNNKKLSKLQLCRLLLKATDEQIRLGKQMNALHGDVLKMFSAYNSLHVFQRENVQAVAHELERFKRSLNEVAGEGGVLEDDVNVM